VPVELEHLRADLGESARAQLADVHELLGLVGARGRPRLGADAGDGRRDVLVLLAALEYHDDVLEAAERHAGRLVRLDDLRRRRLLTRDLLLVVRRAPDARARRHEDARLRALATVEPAVQRAVEAPSLVALRVGA